MRLSGVSLQVVQLEGIVLECLAGGQTPRREGHRLDQLVPLLDGGEVAEGLGLVAAVGLDEEGSSLGSLAGALQPGHEADSVEGDRCGGRDSGRLQQRGHQVDVCGDAVVGARLEARRPAKQEGHPDASLVDRAP